VLQCQNKAFYACQLQAVNIIKELYFKQTVFNEIIPDMIIKSFLQEFELNGLIFIIQEKK